MRDFKASSQESNLAPKTALESLAGKLSYACRVCVAGGTYLYHTRAQHPLPLNVTLSEGVWNDLLFWENILDVTKGAWSGVQKHMLGTKDTHVSTANKQLYTDASKTYGVRGVMGTSVPSQPWKRDMQAVHIGVLETRALLVSLQHWMEHLLRRTVQAWMYNIRAVCASKLGASRTPAMRFILTEIAMLGVHYGFELKALNA